MDWFSPEHPQHTDNTIKECALRENTRRTVRVGIAPKTHEDNPKLSEKLSDP